MNMNLTIKSRLIGLLGFLCLVMIGLGGFGIYGMSQINHGLYEVYEHRTVPIGHIGDVRALMMRNYMQVNTALNDPAASTIREAAKAVDQNSRQAQRLWDGYLSQNLSQDEREAALAFETRRKTFMDDGVGPALAALEAGDLQQAMQVAQEVMKPEFTATMKDADGLIAYEVEQAQQKYQQEVALFSTVRGITVTAIVIALGLAGVIGFMIIRAIVMPLDQAVRVASAIAEGDLTQDVEAGRRDETGLLLDAMKRMSERLRQLIREIIDSSGTVAAEARQIASANVSLSQRTEEQASSLEETASAMEQMTATVRQSAENASQANQLASHARSSAGSGGAVVGRAVAAMSEINQSSQRVADIISVIDEIAFQTNLLALNAAVEAARAGEQGRGFAVVAAEVRNLAQRSASSAREIKELIEDSVSKVTQGSELVEQSGTTLDEIMERVNKVTGMVAEIAAASEEQASGIEQVNRAIAQLDELTQQNAAMVEEATASSQSQAELAHRLQDLVNRYRVERDGAGPLRPSGKPQLSVLDSSRSAASGTHG